ncbi:MAG TPA: hypothetical protein VF406_11215 [Thermodesulfobacteriota bacterium]
MKSPGLAAVLSFFWPGVGQIYNGQIAKGLALVVVHAVAWALVWVVIGVLLVPVVWIYAIYDAYRTAERINADRGTLSTF